MKIAVTQRHIHAAKLSQGHRTPLEIAIMEMDCFEEVVLCGADTGAYALELDGMPVSLPARIQRALARYADSAEMAPCAFDLPIDNSHFVEAEAYLFDDMGFEFGYA